LPREAATARAQVGVLGYPYLSTPTGAPGPGPHTVPSAVGPGPKQCTGTRGPRRAESTSISAAPHGNGTRRLRRRGMGRAHDLLMERATRPPLPHKSRGSGRGSPPCALITSSSTCKRFLLALRLHSSAAAELFVPFLPPRPPWPQRPTRRKRRSPRRRNPSKQPSSSLTGSGTSSSHRSSACKNSGTSITCSGPRAPMRIPAPEHTRPPPRTTIPAGITSLLPFSTVVSVLLFRTSSVIS